MIWPWKQIILILEIMTGASLDLLKIGFSKKLFFVVVVVVVVVKVYRPS